MLPSFARDRRAVQNQEGRAVCEKVGEPERQLGSAIAATLQYTLNANNLSASKKYNAIKGRAACHFDRARAAFGQAHLNEPADGDGSGRHVLLLRRPTAV